MKKLRSMSYGQLIALRARIDATLRRFDVRDRREMTKLLEKVAAARGPSGQPRGHALKGRKLKPKYRNPENRTQTWAGRGLQPRWLREQLKRGKKLASFQIG